MTTDSIELLAQPVSGIVPPIVVIERRPRIGIYDPNLEFSGLTRSINAILSGINSSEFEVILFARKRGPHASRRGIRVVHLPESQDHLIDSSGRKSSKSLFRQTKAKARAVARYCWINAAPSSIKQLAGFYRDSKRLAAFFRPWQIDLLHLQLVGADEAAYAAQKAGIEKIVGTLQIDSGRSRWFDRVLQWVTNHSLDRAIAVSNTTKTDWVRRSRLSESVVEVIPNAIDLSKIGRCDAPYEARTKLGLPLDDRTWICTVGRLAPQKGYKYLFDAVSKLSSRHPTLSVALAGDGPSLNELRHQAKTCGIADRVFFLGFRSDIQVVLDAADIFALPSLWEALPFSLLEAMASGVPVIGTAVAGVPEVILDGVTGILIPPQDADSLAQGLSRLVNDAPLRKRLAAAAKLHIERNYEQTQAVNRTLELFRSMLKDQHLAPLSKC